MGFWFFMLIVNLLIPFVMVGFCRVFLKNAPKKINHTYGYRTARSMKNKDTWEFAHKYIGNLWYKWGLGMVLPSVVVMLLLRGKEESTIGTWGAVLCIIQCVVLVGTIFPTEKALEKTFDENGIRKN